MKSNLMILIIISFTTNLISFNKKIKETFQHLSATQIDNEIHKIINDKNSTASQIIEYILNSPVTTYITPQDLTTAESIIKKSPNSYSKKIVLKCIQHKKQVFKRNTYTEQKSYTSLPDDI